MFLFLASAWVSLRQVATIGNQQILFTLLIAPYYMYILHLTIYIFTINLTLHLTIHPTIPLKLYLTSYNTPYFTSYNTAWYKRFLKILNTSTQRYHNFHYNVYPINLIQIYFKIKCMLVCVHHPCLNINKWKFGRAALMSPLLKCLAWFQFNASAAAPQSLKRRLKHSNIQQHIFNIQIFSVAKYSNTIILKSSNIFIGPRYTWGPSLSN